jgi:hypothetical protein
MDHLEYPDYSIPLGAPNDSDFGFVLLQTNAMIRESYFPTTQTGGQTVVIFTGKLHDW